MDMSDECDYCRARRDVPGTDGLVTCLNPDPALTGDDEETPNGWDQRYPHRFDPKWKTDYCENFGEWPAMNMTNECWFCAERGTVIGNIGISCNNPDPNMTGDERAIKKGWFDYPRKFEPYWKTKLCNNFRVG